MLLKFATPSLKIFSLLLFTLLLSACSQDQTVPCREGNYGWQIYGYDTSQLSVFYINTYEKGTHFAHQLSHTVSGTSFHRDSVYGPDTVAYAVSFYAHPYPETFGGRLNAAYDYEFDFPLAGRTFWFREITSVPASKKYKKYGGAVCVRPFTYYLNDSLHHYPMTEVSNKASMATMITFYF